MNQDKMHLVNKIFNNETIRTVWDKEEEKYYISVVDIIRAVSESNNPQTYWRVLKKRLKDEGNETVTNCNVLKLKAKDGKYRMTDVVDIEGMFRIIESVPSKNAEPIKQWLAGLGSERINETFDPSLAAQRAIDLYRVKGYEENWISRRIKTLQERKQLTDVWQDNGIKSNVEYAILTNEIYKTWSGMSAKEYKQFKGLRKENLRDNMDNIELILTDLSEEATKRIAAKQKPQGLKENITVAHKGGNIAKQARDNLENELGESVITPTNKLNYEYIDKKKLEMKSDRGRLIYPKQIKRELGAKIIYDAICPVASNAFYGFNPYEKEDHESMVAEDMGDSYNRCSQIADASIEIEEIIKDLSEAELRDEKVLKVVLKKCIESKSDIKPMANGKSLDMLTDKIMELVKDVYL